MLEPMNKILIKSTLTTTEEYILMINQVASIKILIQALTFNLRICVDDCILFLKSKKDKIKRSNISAHLNVVTPTSNIKSKLNKFNDYFMKDSEWRVEVNQRESNKH